MGLLKGLKIGKISLKRKAGGTFIGNKLRSVVNNASHGVLGNGTMMRKADETKDAYQDRLLSGVGAAATAYENQTASYDGKQKGQDPADSIQTGAIGQLIKQYMPYALGGIVVIIALIFSLKKRR